MIHICHIRGQPSSAGSVFLFSVISADESWTKSSVSLVQRWTQLHIIKHGATSVYRKLTVLRFYQQCSWHNGRHAAWCSELTEEAEVTSFHWDGASLPWSTSRLPVCPHALFCCCSHNIRIDLFFSVGKIISVRFLTKYGSIWVSLLRSLSFSEV